jgi:hypothetical protein
MSGDKTPYKRKPTNQKSQRDIQEEIMRAEEEEKERLKGLMIGICSFLESTYKEEIYKITLERDQTLHYDVELE